MVLTIHHLGVSQSDRILWLCEELHLDYKLVTHTRAPNLAPASLKSLPGNASGKAPFMEDPDAGVTLSESGAIAEYIIHRYGSGQLSVGPDAHPKAYAEFLKWFHFSNATLQPAMVNCMMLDGAGVSPEDGMKKFADGRLTEALQQLDDRLGVSQWVAGAELTVADIMTVYCLTTQRYFGPLISLKPYGNVLRFLQDCAKREAFQRALEKGDPEMEPLIGAEAPGKSFMEAGGAERDIWKGKK
ncbi:hypothetical protein LTR53_013807 [Teratosphaeriaceae sp. CCFEE 6253]|nr:hypothetical protein LTR53_013807 [Teratosphaeriaceae sp. CCFEE 6253]